MSWGFFVVVLSVLLPVTCSGWFFGSDGWQRRGEWIVMILVWCCLNSSWLTHTFKSNRLRGGRAGWETVLFLRFPSDTAVCTTPCEVCLLLSHLFFLKYSVLSLFTELQTSVLWRGLNRSPAFVILIPSFRVFGTLSADLVSEIYIQSTNTNENIKPGQRQTLWVSTCSHFPVR